MSARDKAHIPRDSKIAECGYLMSLTRLMLNSTACKQCNINARQIWDFNSFIVLPENDGQQSWIPNKEES